MAPEEISMKRMAQVKTPRHRRDTGKQLICVRYRYDDQRRKRFTTIEIIFEESDWSPPEKPEIVGLRVEFRETELRRRVKQSGGKWNSAKRGWEIHYD